MRAIAAAVLAAALVCAGCSDDGSSSSAPTTDLPAPTIPDRGNVDGQLKIGYLLPTSGQSASVGPPMINGIEMATRDINAVGGVNGEDVVIVGGDEGDDPSVAGVTVDRLINTDKVDVLVGPASSTTALRVLGRVTSAGVLACSPSNTAMALEQFPDNGYYVRSAPSDRLQAVALAEVIAEGGYQTVAIMSPNDDYGQSLADVLADELKVQGIRVTISYAYDPNGTNFAPDARKVLETDPEAIAVIGLPDTGGMVLRKLSDLGAGPDRMPTFVTDGLRVPNLYQFVDPTHPESTAGIRGTAVATVPYAPSSAFSEEYAAFAPGSPETLASYAYDCAVILALAAQATRSDDPSVIRDEIVNVTRGGVTCRTFADCKHLLDLGRNIDYDGASGPLDLTDIGDPSRGTYDVFVYNPDGTDTTERQVQVSPD
ncbi:MAG TPA: ABC transporter substrate-binding protein [Acidimicrobiales bacterium]|nr:ABC transporter substrate-binding protein [Acidimicrobiales bacterium]